MKKLFAIHKVHIAIAGILFLLLSQTFALLHSAEHYFHEADSLCSIYQSVDNSTPGIITPALLVELPFNFSFRFSHPVNLQVKLPRLSYHSRAPPVV